MSRTKVVARGQLRSDESNTTDSDRFQRSYFAADRPPDSVYTLETFLPARPAESVLGRPLSYRF